MPPRSIPIARPSFTDQEWQAVRETLASGWVIQGPRVKAFEEAFARRHQVPYAVATSSGTTALHLALVALGIGPGDEVIVPAFTWVATANVVIHAGAIPVFVDVRDDTCNIDSDQVRTAITGRTRAIIPVHLFGRCADMDALGAVLPEHVSVIEDAACAAGATFHGRPAGSLGSLGCFSFHPRKSITTGEGGMVVTGDARMARRLQELRNHGIQEPGPEDKIAGFPLLADVVAAGFNYRMTDIQAAIGLVQLARLDALIAQREQWARWYAEALSDIDWLQVPRAPSDGGHAWQAFVMVLKDNAPATREELMIALQEQGIATRPGTHAVPGLSYYRRRFGFAAGQFPTAKRLDDRSLAIPLHNCMSAEDYQYVADALHRF